ncbi:hypothetical protein Poly21_38790 [Allorhodopirellula heiligendammensis]|uniref:Uncharacterized protein n=1 Tax=Allorhodopirellula heiligendammensis TaxID=2714739 RepID=A0A5C6C0J6_9BACT|nr:hypothetical protein Poly21_38790 [Allorhodopirellula heiligendammensis]
MSVIAERFAGGLSSLGPLSRARKSVSDGTMAPSYEIAVARRLPAQYRCVKHSQNTRPAVATTARICSLRPNSERHVSTMDPRLHFSVRPHGHSFDPFQPSVEIGGRCTSHARLKRLVERHALFEIPNHRIETAFSLTGQERLTDGSGNLVCPLGG